MGDALGEVAKAIIGPPSSSFADIYAVVLGDRIANWRLRNAIEAHSLVQREADKAGLKMLPSKIPERFAYSWFEEVSKQDDSDVQALFAKLLARAAGGQVTPDERLVRMLSLMTPSDALVFKAFYADREPINAVNKAGGFFRDPAPIIDADQFLRSTEKEWPDEAAKSIESLVNIGCLRRHVHIGKSGFGYQPKIVRDFSAGRLEEPDWDKLVKDRTKQREVLSATDLGRLLAKATLDTKESEVA